MSRRYDFIGRLRQGSIVTRINHLIANVLGVAVLVLAGTSPARADGSGASQVKAPVVLPMPVEDAFDSSADGKLSSLLADTPEVSVTESCEGAPPVKKVSPFPPAGSRIVARWAWLGYDAHRHWYVLHFIGGDAGPALRDLRVLPSELLSAMEAVLAVHPDPVFEVAGEISVYKDQGYILLANVVLITGGSDPADQPTDQLTDKKVQSPKTQPASSPAPATDEPPSASDVLAQMLAQEPSSAIISVEIPMAVPVQAESVGPVLDDQTVLPISYGMVVWRLVRVIPANDGQWMEVRFEADNTLQEPPIRILPSKLLARAQKWTNAAKGQTVKLRVTGQITQYKGRAYLMLRNVILERDMGQF